jgi:hypothetical protein
LDYCTQAYKVWHGEISCLKLVIDYFHAFKGTNMSILMDVIFPYATAEAVVTVSLQG